MGLLALLTAVAGLAAAPAMAEDCNNNGIDDLIDIYTDCTSLDLDDSGVPDECEIAAGLIPDCNANGIADWADIFGASDACGNPVGGSSIDCDNNGVPDDCQLAGGDCNANGVPDICDLRDGLERDDNLNAIPDSCELAAGTAPDCNENGVPDLGDVRRRLGFDDRTYTFIAPPNAPTFPINLAVGDVNGDGHADIVTANRAFPSGESLGVFINDGDGTFAAGRIYNTTGAAEAVALGDFDGDGDLDAAVAQRVISNFPVTIMLNNGSGQFTLGANIPAGQVPIDIDAGDMDADGDIDLVVADINGGQLVLLRNNGAGSFTTGSQVAVGSRPLGARFADLDGDGDLDIAAIVQTTSTTIVLANNGTGTFSTLWSQSVGGEFTATDLAIHDMNGDGDLDLCLALQYSREVAVRLNQGGTFSDLIRYGPNAGNPVAVAAGDFDGDGIADLATTLSPPWPNGPMSILRGAGDGVVSPPTSFLAGYSCLSLASGDFDADGRDDLATGVYQERRIRVWLNRNLAPVSADANNDDVPDECACPADFDGSGFVDTDDFDAFVLAFEAGGDNADFDGSGFVDTDDYDAYVLSFEAGC